MPTPAPTAPSGPFMGSAAVVPGTIEVEEFDYGGEGIGYHETSPGNSGGVSLRFFEVSKVWASRMVNSVGAPALQAPELHPAQRCRTAVQGIDFYLPKVSELVEV